MEINSKTKVTGLLGFPVEHSLSPYMHNAGFKALNLDFVYAGFKVEPSSLKDAVAGVRALNFRGVNVTVPHKENVIQFLDELTDEAKAIGAVNTIINENGKLIGDNTDGRGFVRSLEEELGLDVNNQNVFVCGAGGAARSIVVSLVRKGAKIFLTDLDIVKAENLAKVDKNVEVVANNDLNDIILKSVLIVNATPCGMHEDDETIPFPVDKLDTTKRVYDIVYNRETALIKFCKKKDIPCINGLEMLLYQGVLAFEAWTSAKAPVIVMRESLKKKL